MVSLRNPALGMTGVAAVLLLALLWVYGGSLGHELIFDDARFMDGSIKLGEAYQIQPAFRSLWIASFHWVHDIFGADWRWQRAVNVGLHVANAIALWGLAVRLLQRAVGSADDDGKKRALGWAALVGVAVWAFNPVAAYAVVYLIQRSTLLATFFSVCLMLAFIEGMRAEKWAGRLLWGGVAVLCYGLALMSKEHAAPIVAVLLPLYVYWMQPSGRALVKAMLPLAVVVVLCAVWLVGVKGWSIGAVAEDNVKPFLAELEAFSPGASERVYTLSVINQLWLFFRYGLLWFVPWPGMMSVDIRTAFPVGVFQFPFVLGPVGFLLMVVGSIWMLLNRQGLWRLIGFLLLIPVVLYVTELAYVRLQEPFVLYRSYLWSIPVPVFFALLMLWFVEESKWIFVVVVAFCGVLSLGLLDRVESLRNGYTAWGDVVKKISDVADSKGLYPGRWRAYLNLALEHMRRKNFSDAFAFIQTSKRLGLPESTYQINAGAILVGAGRPDVAVRIMEPLMRESDVPHTAYFNLAAAYKFTGQGQRALEAFDKGLQDPKVRDKDKAAVLLDAGTVALSLKNWSRAEEYFRQHLAIQPNTVEAIIGLANAWYETDRRQEALEWLSAAIQKNPAADLHHARAYIYLHTGDKERARADNARALELRPGHPPFEAMRRAIEGGR